MFETPRRIKGESCYPCHAFVLFLRVVLLIVVFFRRSLQEDVRQRRPKVFRNQLNHVLVGHSYHWIDQVLMSEHEVRLSPTFESRVHSSFAFEDKVADKPLHVRFGSMGSHLKTKWRTNRCMSGLAPWALARYGGGRAVW
jgi:hypothetical protein